MTPLTLSEYNFTFARYVYIFFLGEGGEGFTYTVVFGKELTNVAGGGVVSSKIPACLMSSLFFFLNRPLGEKEEIKY